MSTEITTTPVSQQDSPLTAEAARELTDTIRARVAQVWELVTQAYIARIWKVLDYGSWDAYCAAEFDGAQLRIPREDRTEVVASLRESGMSTRAIAAATGLSQRTVANVAREQNCSPETVIGLDDKVYRPKPVEPDQIPLDTGIDAPDVPDKPSEPAPRRRKPITDSFDTARSELVTKATTLVRLTGDDRFGKHAEQIAHRNLGDLLRARDALNQVIDRLSDPSDRPEEG